MVRHLRKHNRAAARATAMVQRGLQRRDPAMVRGGLAEFDELFAEMALDHPDRSASLGNAAGGCMGLFELTHDPADLDRLVRAQKSVMDADPYVLGVYRRDLFGFLAREIARQYPGPGTLAEMVPLVRESEGDRFLRVGMLAICLHAAAERSADPALLAELVEVDRERVALSPPGNPDQPEFLTDLSVSLRRLALRTGRRELLVEAAEAGRRAMPSGDPLVLSGFGNTLHALFIYVDRAPATLRESISVGRAAVAAAPPGHQHEGTALTNLGIALRTSYEETGDLAELRESAEISRSAVAAARAGSDVRARYLANLSACCQELYKRTREGAWLEEAATTIAEAVELTSPADRERAGRLTELAIALHLLGLLEAAVQAARQAVDAGAPGDIAHAARLNNLTIVARALFESTGDRTALDEAVQAGRDAVEAAPAGTAEGAGIRTSLVRALAQLPPGREVVDEMAAVWAELDAATATPRTWAIASVLLGAAAMNSAAMNSAVTKAEDYETALRAYGKAVELLPQVASRRLLRPDREHGLAELAGLPADAAAAALSLGRPGDALRLLEHARGLLLAESIGARRDLEALRRADPVRADELTRLRDLLDASDRAGVDLYHGDEPPAVWRGDRTRDHRALAERWESLLAEIRALPGMAGFLRPPSDLTPAAGPIVVVNVSRFRCDALLLAPGEPVRSIRLDTDYAELQASARVFQEPRPDQQRLQHELALLADRVVKPPLAALGLLASSPRSAGDAPRVWWCPVGIASFLPLHAAALDHVVSSYTATVAALKPHETPARRSGAGLLVIEMSRTPGARDLPAAATEARQLTELVPDATVLAGPAATRDAVLAALPRHRIAHFACHAVTDERSPALNRLLLHDHRSAALTAIELSAPDSSVELGFLSACETARSSEALADEVMHIATAIQLAGCRHVVGTLWPVSDTAAAHIAAGFYAALAPAFDTGGTARALHRAVLALRAEVPDKPSRWASHIHLESA